MRDTALFTALALAGALSPLLTFLWLFQLKEWRWDRLREHLRAEGVWGTLWGRIRPIVLLATMLACWASLGNLWTLRAGLGIFAMLGAAQIVLRRQRFPVWTRKAQILATLSVLVQLLLLAAAAAIQTAFIPLAAALHPLTVLAAWAAFLPVDRAQKRKVFAQAKIARERDPERLVIGIAGSVGKTTTKNLIGHLLQDLRPLTTPEHVNTEMGVAQWMLRTLGADSDPGGPLVVEMGAYRTGEIALLCGFARPTIGVVTALGSDHLALFGSEAAIVDANGELLQALPQDGHAFVQTDTEGGRHLADRTACAQTRVGENPMAHERPEDAREDEHGLAFLNRGTRFTVALRGRHNAVNALTAIAVARHFGLADARIAQLLAEFRPHAGTFALRTERGVTILDDTYNASRLSMRAALDWMRERSERPRVLLTSGILELGAEHDRILEELGAAAKGACERVVFTTDTGRAAFAKGFGAPVELLGTATPKITSGSLLTCVGRMPASVIPRLLPAA